MTQATGFMSGVASYVASSTDGTTFTDRSGFANAVEVGGQSRMSGETYSFDGDGAMITYGKLEPIEITVRIVYTEGAQEFFKAAQTAFQTAGGGRFQIRWVPAGNTAGKYQYTSGADSKIIAFNWPSPDATSGDPILVEITIKTASITQAAVAT